MSRWLQISLSGRICCNPPSLQGYRRLFLAVFNLQIKRHFYYDLRSEGSSEVHRFIVQPICVLRFWIYGISLPARISLQRFSRFPSRNNHYRTSRLLSSYKPTTTMTAAHAIPEESAPEVAGAENANEGSNNPDAAGGVEARPPPPLDNADAAGGAGGAQLPDDDAPPPPDAAAPGGQEMAAAADDADADAGAAMPQQMQALATDLSSYFATLQGALSQQRSANGNSATGIGSTVVSLLLDGTSLVVAAGNAAGVDIWGFMSAAAGTHNSPPGALLTPRQAALYLYAVGQNVVALEAAVLGSRPPPAMFAAAGGGGFDMDEANVGGGGGGITAKQVAEIVSASGLDRWICFAFLAGYFLFVLVGLVGSSLQSD